MKEGLTKCPQCRLYPLSAFLNLRHFHTVELTTLDPYLSNQKWKPKRYGCVFTRLATRAVHLELMSDMSTEKFLLGFRRFLASHGKPKEIISDNASQFKLASDTIDKLWKLILSEKDVVSYAANDSIKWKYIVELAPWMGGFYERLIGLVNRSLRKAIEKLCLSLEQLLTILKEVEAVINSRPLVYVEDDINSNMTLTSSHFLTLNPKIGIPTCDIDNDDSDFSPNESSTDRLLITWKKGLKHLDRFWKIWRDEYLISLRERTQTRLREARKRSQYPAQIGDVVLIKDYLPRGNWRIGKITELMTSFDEQVRAARIMLASKRIISRPLNLLYPIEYSSETDRNQEGNDDQSQLSQTSDNNAETIRQRPKREAAKRAL